MRYHFSEDCERPATYGELYFSDDPIYSRGTLFKIGKKGLVVIQQRYDPETKHTWWSEIDPWLCNELYLHPRFKSYFEKIAGEDYPVVCLRQVMWALRMKPLKREPWETYFDRKVITRKKQLL